MVERRRQKKRIVILIMITHKVITLLLGNIIVRTTLIRFDIIFNYPIYYYKEVNWCVIDTSNVNISHSHNIKDYIFLIYSG